MNAGDAAAVLGVTVARLLELATDGQIPGAVLTARGWSFNRRGLEQYLARQAKRRAA